MITDDQKLISNITTYFKELDKINRLFNTPSRKKNIEEEKSTYDTPPKNKYENRNSMQANVCSNFMVTPFDNKNENQIIEEENHFEPLDQMLFGLLEKYSKFFSE